MNDSTHPPARRGDAPIPAHPHWDVHALLENPVGALAIALGQWEDGRPRPFARTAASRAMDTIDAMLRELHLMRARLIGEIRASDDEAAARVDAMLAMHPGA